MGVSMGSSRVTAGRLGTAETAGTDGGKGDGSGEGGFGSMEGISGFGSLPKSSRLGGLSSRNGLRIEELEVEESGLMSGDWNVALCEVFTSCFFPD